MPRAEKCQSARFETKSAERCQNNNYRERYGGAQKCQGGSPYGRSVTIDQGEHQLTLVGAGALTHRGELGFREECRKVLKVLIMLTGNRALSGTFRPLFGTFSALFRHHARHGRTFGTFSTFRALFGTPLALFGTLWHSLSTTRAGRAGRAGSEPYSRAGSELSTEPALSQVQSRL